MTYPLGFYAHPKGSFQVPVIPPGVEADAEPLVCATWSKAWTPYILGAMAQLQLQSTWLVGEGYPLLTTLGQVQDLMSIVGAQQGCSEYNTGDGNSLTFMSSDGGCYVASGGRGEWVSGVGWIPEISGALGTYFWYLDLVIPTSPMKFLTCTVEYHDVYFEGIVGRTVTQTFVNGAAHQPSMFAEHIGPLAGTNQTCSLVGNGLGDVGAFIHLNMAVGSKTFDDGIPFAVDGFQWGGFVHD